MKASAPLFSPHGRCPSIKKHSFNYHIVSQIGRSVFFSESLGGGLNTLKKSEVITTRQIIQVPASSASSSSTSADSVADESIKEGVKVGEAGNGAVQSQKEEEDWGGLEDEGMVFKPLEGWNKLSVQTKMLFAPPWQRVKKGSVLVMKLSGEVPEQFQALSQMVSLPQLCSNLKKAAIDPRISCLVLKIEPLGCGWGKIQELKRHIAFFNKSGKNSIAYLSVAGEKEYFLAASCSEIYAPPSAYISFRGLAVQGQFLGGVLEKAGVTPQIQRIGKFKSAGDQLSRKDMSDANREMLTAILDDIYSTWISGIASARGKTIEELEKLLEEGVVELKQLKDIGLITDIKYENEIEEMLKERLGQKADKPLQAVNFKKYSRVREGTLGLTGWGDAIAVIRASGAIGRGKGMSGGGVKSDSFIEKLRMAKENKQFKAIILRIDSPGGDALASDLMWQEIRECCKTKPVIASMGDVAASGGYYMAMASPVIVAEPLTLTGSIGVVTGKFILADLYERIGFSKEIISRGRFAEVDAEQRLFREDEKSFVVKGAQAAYASFRDKAAVSRHMEIKAMEERAQGRVWTGKAAIELKLVDVLGGFSVAVEIAKKKAGLSPNKPVRLIELSRSGPSIAALLSMGAQLAVVLSRGHPAREAAIQNLLTEFLMPSGMTQISPNSIQARMDEIVVDGVGNLESMTRSEAVKAVGLEFLIDILSE